MAKIRFETKLLTIGSRTVLRLPQSASEKLPSRGQVAVKGKINNHEFETVLEPDGYREQAGHWMPVGKALQKAAGIVAGDSATLEIESTKEWPEPEIPEDFRAALARAPEKVQALWNATTPMARWEWIRWVNATRDPNTRKRRVEVSISKMKSGKRRPCCFDLSACTDPELSKNGRLIEPTKGVAD